MVVRARTPPRLVTAAAVRVSRWLSTPITPSTNSASTGMDVLLVWGGRELASAWEQVTAQQNCDGSQPGAGLDRLLIRPARWPGRRRHHRRQLRPQGNPSGASCTTSHTAVPAPKPDSDPPRPPPPHSQLHNGGHHRPDAARMLCLGSYLEPAGPPVGGYRQLMRMSVIHPIP